MSRSLYTTIGLRRILRPINRKLKSKGLSTTLKRVVEDCSSGLEIELPETTKKVLKDERVLLICNHPAQIEVLMLLAAIPPRRKVFLVVMHSLLSILPAINKHLIPVYIGHRIGDRSKNNLWLRLFGKLHFSPEYSPEVAHGKNIKSMALVTRRINEGALVGIFPAGGSINGRDFLPGVGHIIKNLKYPKETKVVMAYVSGTSSWDFFRIIPLLGKILPKLKIKFSMPLEATNICGGSGRLIANSLQDIYDRWSLPLKPLPKFQSVVLSLRSILFFIFFNR